MWQSSEQYGTYTAKGTDGNTYTWNNDVWGGSPGPQTISVVSNNNWGVTSDQVFNTNTWVQTYPHIGWAGGKKFTEYPMIVGTSKAAGPGYGSGLQWETAYDIWLNADSPGADNGYEIMVWTDVANVSPGRPLKEVLTIQGTTYSMYQGDGGNGPATWFVKHGNSMFAETHLKTLIYNAFTVKGNYSGPVDPVISTIEFGWEVWGTGGRPVKFHCAEYSLRLK